MNGLFARIFLAIRSFFTAFLGAKPMLTSSKTMDLPDKIYYFPVDANNKETGEAILVDLNANGSANLSRLPETLRHTLESEGVSDTLRLQPIMPSAGKQFLMALLRRTNPYFRFRTSPNQNV